MVSHNIILNIGNSYAISTCELVRSHKLADWTWSALGWEASLKTKSGVCNSVDSTLLWIWIEPAAQHDSWRQGWEQKQTVLLEILYFRWHIKPKSWSFLVVKHPGKLFTRVGMAALIPGQFPMWITIAFYLFKALSLSSDKVFFSFPNLDLLSGWSEMAPICNL